MSLVRAEVRRLGKRRFTRWTLVAMVLVLGVVVVFTSLSSQRHTPELLAAAQATAQEEFRLSLAQHQQMVTACEAAKNTGRVDELQKYPPDCGKGQEPTPGSIDAQWYLPFQFTFSEFFPGYLVAFFTILALFAYLVGASFVGVEWNSGGMMNLLLWRPKRVPVLLTKLGVLLAGVAATGVVLSLLWTLAFWLIGRYDGTLGQLSAGSWQSFALSGLRGLILALAVAAVGFSLASIGRHTAMALGAAIGVGVLVEIGLQIGLNLATVPFPERFVPSTYVGAWFLKKRTLLNESACQFNQIGECRPTEFVITWQTSGVVLGLATALILAAAIWTLRKRDVT